MDSELVTRLQEIVGSHRVITDPEGVETYAGEHTMESYQHIAPRPAAGCVVVRPETAAEVAAIINLAQETGTPVVPKGGKTALAANAIPMQPSIIVTAERMNRILEIDEENLTITCEPGVTLGELVAELGAHPSLYFPLHPGDEGAQVGGMVAMNAGGVRAIRHGVMREHVRGLEVVLPNGEIVHFGGREGKLVKDNAGYNLMHLIIGSEGTLGFITRVTLRLLPRSAAGGNLIVAFADRASAFKSVPKILEAGIIPLAVEYVERDQIVKTAHDLGQKWPLEGQEGTSDLIVFMAEDSEDELYEKSAQVEEICSEYGAVNVLIAESKQEQQAILDIRSHVLPSIESDIVDMLDVTVPRGYLPELIETIDGLCAEYDTEMPIIAHAGDGNLHVFLLQENGQVPPYYPVLKDRIYRRTLELAGTITGEHGIGSLRKQELRQQLAPSIYQVMVDIKRAFDPRGIMNPGKVVDPNGH